MATAVALSEQQELPYTPAPQRVSGGKSGSLLGDYGLQVLTVAPKKSKLRPELRGGAAAAVRKLELAAEAQRASAAQAELTQNEFRWLAENRRRYANLWVALEGDNLVATGNSAREVYAAIAQHPRTPFRTPLVTHVEAEEEVHFAGW